MRKWYTTRDWEQLLATEHLPTGPLEGHQHTAIGKQGKDVALSLFTALRFGSFDALNQTHDVAAGNVRHEATVLLRHRRAGLVIAPCGLR